MVIRLVRRRSAAMSRCRGYFRILTEISSELDRPVDRCASSFPWETERTCLRMFSAYFENCKLSGFTLQRKISCQAKMGFQASFLFVCLYTPRNLKFCQMKISNFLVYVCPIIAHQSLDRFASSLRNHQNQVIWRLLGKLPAKLGFPSL